MHVRSSQAMLPLPASQPRTCSHMQSLRQPRSTSRSSSTHSQSTIGVRPITGSSSSTDAPSAVAPADVTVSLPVADDDDEPRECPGVSRASVVAGEGGGQIYARDVVSAPPNQAL